MTIIDGEYVPDGTDKIQSALFEDAKEYFGEDLNDEELAVIRMFYLPVAARLAEAQGDIGLVLSSTQIDNAQGRSLDLLTSLIGVVRNEAEKSVGEVTFSRESPGLVDYPIPRRTVVQTNESDPVRYETDRNVVLAEGESEITVPITAQTGGADHNVGANTITVMPSPPIGIESVINSDGTSGGINEESDDLLRERAKSGLAENSASTAPALVTAVDNISGVLSTSIFINDSNVSYEESGGLPDHSFELVVDGAEDEEIGNMILEKKAAGDTAYGGVNGELVEVESELPTGQMHTVAFSRPVVVKIYVDMDIQTTDEYAGDMYIRDSVVSYIGGLLSGGGTTTGNLGVGKDVLYTRVLQAVLNIRGVHDVLDLKIGVTSPPSASENIVIETNERPTSDATDQSITVESTVIS